MAPTSIAIVGVGKIARDQHIPSIARNPDFELAATVSRSGGIDGIENFSTVDSLLDARPDIAALALCMPPRMRFEAAVAVLRAGRHVLLEKPPGATVAEVQALVALAKAQGVSLFATWHSRFAAGVESARRWIAEREVQKVEIVWKEDVRRWHPGQDWIWEPGGLGVFDPGVNALSIATAILPPLHLKQATLEFPEGRDAPIAATLEFAGAGFSMTADFDWRQTGPQTWDITVETANGRLILSEGGAKLAIDGIAVPLEPVGEYDAIYRRFVDLVRQSEIDVDLAPQIHVADAFMLARRSVVDPFVD